MTNGVWPEGENFFESGGGLYFQNCSVSIVMLKYSDR
jgi:hypothetical protein